MTISADTDDPFASLFLPATHQTSQLYISGRLTLLRVPPGTCGEWLCYAFLTPTPTWHRRLDANAYLWLRNRVQSAIESGKLSSDFHDALATLSWIAEIGIAHGAFTAEEIGPCCRASEIWEFNAGLPHWADSADF